MGVFAATLELNLDRDWTALSFFLVLLAVLFFFFTIFAGLRSASTRMNDNILWPAILGVLGLIGLVLLAEFRDSGADSVRFSVETDGLSVESGPADSVFDPDEGFSTSDGLCTALPCTHDHDDFGLHTHQRLEE